MAVRRPVFGFSVGTFCTSTFSAPNSPYNPTEQKTRGTAALGFPRSNVLVRFQVDLPNIEDIGGWDVVNRLLRQCPARRNREREQDDVDAKEQTAQEAA